MKIYLPTIIATICLFYLGCNPTGEDSLPYIHEFSEIYSMKTDGADLLQLTSGTRDIWALRYLPQGDKLLFHRDDGMFIMNTDGNQLKQLTPRNIGSSYLSISNDEQYGYYAQMNDSGCLLYSISLTTGEVKTIAQESDWIYDASISLDGATIVYAVNTGHGETSGLYLLNVATHEKRKIKSYSNDVFCRYPRFIPNSNKVLYFQSIASSSNQAVIGTIDIGDSTKEAILDTVTNSRAVYPEINSKGEIFYDHNEIMVLNVNTNQRMMVPILPMQSSTRLFVSWSFDEAKLVITDYRQHRIMVYSTSGGTVVGIAPSQNGTIQQSFLKKDNQSVVYLVSFMEEVWS